MEDSDPNFLLKKIINKVEKQIGTKKKTAIYGDDTTGQKLPKYINLFLHKYIPSSYLEDPIDLEKLDQYCLERKKKLQNGLQRKKRCTAQSKKIGIALAIHLPIVAQFSAWFVGRFFIQNNRIIEEIYVFFSHFSLLEQILMGLGYVALCLFPWFIFDRQVKLTQKKTQNQIDHIVFFTLIQSHMIKEFNQHPKDALPFYNRWMKACKQNVYAEKKGPKLPTIDKEEQAILEEETRNYTRYDQSLGGDKWIKKGGEKSGAFGIVRNMIEKHKSNAYYMRVIKYLRLDPDKARATAEEFKVCQQIIDNQLIDDRFMRIFSAVDDEKQKFIISEHIPYSFESEYLKGEKKPEEVFDLVKQLLACLQALKKNNICHRDLKPENLMIDPYGFIKIIDFGSAFILQSEDQKMKEICGTLDYLAPEMIKKGSMGQCSYNRKCDIWSMGVIIDQVIHQGRYCVFHPPGDRWIPKELILNIKNQTYSFRKADDPLFCHFKPLLEGMLKKDPEERWGEKEMETWIKQNENNFSPSKKKKR